VRIRQGLVLCSALVWSTGALKADVIFDAETFGSLVGGTFGTLDATTGVFTEINSGVPNVAGLALEGGNLYGADGDQLYRINAVSGVFTPVGPPSGVFYEEFGGTTSGLFALDTSNNQNLYSIDPITGAATFIGATGVNIAGGGLVSLSNDSDTLYLDDGHLPTVNTATGALIGGIEFTEPFSALVASGGLLYGANRTVGTIDTIDPATGFVTTGPSITGFNGNTIFTGLAPEAPACVPTPNRPCIGGIGGGGDAIHAFVDSARVRELPGRSAIARRIEIVKLLAAVARLDRNSADGCEGDGLSGQTSGLSPALIRGSRAVVCFKNSNHQLISIQGGVLS